MQRVFEWRSPERVIKLTLALCAMVMAFLIFGAGQAQAATLTVNDDTTGPGPTGANCATQAQYATIQAAIDAATAGDTILVCAGTYNERPVVNKSLTINGAQAGVDAKTGRTTVANESVVGNGDSDNVIFAVTADDVTLDGFTVQPTGATSTSVVGIQPSEDDYEIVNNIVTGNTIGLYPGGTGGLIENNRVANNNRAGGVSGSGLYTDVGPTNLVVNANRFETHNNVSMNFGSVATTTNTNIDITNNTVIGNRILLTKTVGSTVSGNTITNSVRSGVQIDFNNQGLDVTGNTITGSGSTVADTFPAVRLTSANDPAAAASNNITVSGNDLRDNEIGIQVQADNKTPDNGLTASFNRIFNNGVGVQNNAAFDINAINNWWGCNEGPDGEEADGCDTVVDTAAGVTDFDPWLVMDITADPTTVAPSGTSDITSSFDQNSDNQPATPNFPDGVSVNFTATGGTVAPASDTTEAAIAETVFTAGQDEGGASVTGSLDAEAVTVDLLIRGEGNEDCDIVGTSGNDTLTGTNGDETICGLGGNDTISGLGGNDELRGGDGNDRLSGGNGTDTIDGGDGDDRADGGGGSDNITGGSGEDNLRGQDGNDTINGGANDDTIFGGAGEDNLNGAGGNDNMSGDNADDTVLGGAGDDILKGGTGTDTVNGNTGNDILLSGTGNSDVLTGGDGNDRLNVRDGTGRDRADGGGGSDNCASDRGDTVVRCEVNSSRSAPMQK